jgi:hypothetical protein
MTEPLIRKRTPAEILTYVAERLREQPDATALIAHSLTLDMLAEELAAQSDPPRIEWANRSCRLERDGQPEIVSAGPLAEGGGEPLARRRMEFPWFTAVLQRTVTFGSWVEAPRETGANDV